MPGVGASAPVLEREGWSSILGCNIGNISPPCFVEANGCQYLALPIKTIGRRGTFFCKFTEFSSKTFHLILGEIRAQRIKWYTYILLREVTVRYPRCNLICLKATLSVLFNIRPFVQAPKIFDTFKTSENYFPLFKI